MGISFKVKYNDLRELTKELKFYEPSKVITFKQNNSYLPKKNKEIYHPIIPLMTETGFSVYEKKNFNTYPKEIIVLDKHYNNTIHVDRNYTNSKNKNSNFYSLIREDYSLLAKQKNEQRAARQNNIAQLIQKEKNKKVISIEGDK